MLYPQFEAVRRKAVTSIQVQLNQLVANEGKDESAASVSEHSHVDLKEGEAVELEVMQKSPLG